MCPAGSEPKVAMAFRCQTALISVAIAVVLLVTLLFAGPSLINLDRYRSEVIAYIERKTGKQIELGKLALSFSPVSIRIDGFVAKNPPLFPPGYIVQVARVDANLDAAALLHRRVVIKALVLDRPMIHLISDPDGPWNFENPQMKSADQMFPLGAIEEVQIKGGDVMVSNLLPSDALGPTLFEARDISTKLSNVNLDAILSPTSSSVDGLGTLVASRLRFGAIQVTNLHAQLKLEQKQAVFSNVTAGLYGGKVKGDLVFKLSGETPTFATRAAVSGIEMVHLLAAFGNVRGLMTGKMAGDLTLTGDIEHSTHPLAGLRGVGHVTVRDGQVPSLKLNANLMRLMHFNDLGPAKEDPSSFNMISTDLELANLHIASKTIDIDGYGVDVDGSGSVSVSGTDELDYRGVAQITSKQGFFTNTFARLSGATLIDGKLTFPFRVGGTIENPTFSKGHAGGPR
jgi:uncharacterized protein involved in outer membrane biogenesis